MTMTFESYLQMHTACTIAEQVILITLFCEILIVLWHDENAKIGAFFCEMLLCGVYVMTDIVCTMGAVMTGLTYIMIISFMTKLIIMIMSLPATVRHHRLISRCRRACRQNQRPLSADDICQAYCRQVRQRKN